MNATTYYLYRGGRLLELRQQRFRRSFEAGKEHPHDVCAVARDEEEMKSMLTGVKISLESVEGWTVNDPPVFHMTRDAVTTLCGLPAAGAIHAYYGGQELDRGTWCEECRAARGRS